MSELHIIIDYPLSYLVKPATETGGGGGGRGYFPDIFPQENSARIFFYRTRVFGVASLYSSISVYHVMVREQKYCGKACKPLSQS